MYNIISILNSTKGHGGQDEVDTKMEMLDALF